METLLNVVENVAGDCTKADAAEQAVIEEVRKLGNEALQGWAERAVQKATEAVRHSNPPYRATGKKSLVAYAFRENRGHGTGLAWPWPQVRPFLSRRGERPELFAAVATGDYRLRRGPWVWPSPEKAAGTLWDHDSGQYGAEDHRRAWDPHAGAAGTGRACLSARPGCRQQIGEIDGSMVPIVTSGDRSGG